MYQDNSVQNFKANEGNGILAVSDSLAFCVSAPKSTLRRPTSQDISHYRTAKLFVQAKLWNDLILKKQRRLI